MTTKKKTIETSDPSEGSDGSVKTVVSDSAYKKSKNHRDGAHVYEFTIPSSGPLADEGKAKRPSERRAQEAKKRTVKLLEPNEDIINDSLELAAPWEQSGQVVFMSVAQGNQLRLCLVEVDGNPVDFAQLEGDGLHAIFNEYERSFLMKALEKISTPSNQEVDDFLKSMRRV